MSRNGNIDCNCRTSAGNPHPRSRCLGRHKIPRPLFHVLQGRPRPLCIPPHTSLRPKHPSLRLPHTSLCPPHSSLRPPHHSLRPPHTSLRLPHPSLRPPHPSLCLPHPSLRPPQPSLRPPRSSSSILLCFRIHRTRPRPGQPCCPRTRTSIPPGSSRSPPGHAPQVTPLLVRTCGSCSQHP